MNAEGIPKSSTTIDVILYNFSLVETSIPEALIIQNTQQWNNFNKIRESVRCFFSKVPKPAAGSMEVCKMLNKYEIC